MLVQVVVGVNKYCKSSVP